MSMNDSETFKILSPPMRSLSVIRTVCAALFDGDSTQNTTNLSLFPRVPPTPPPASYHDRGIPLCVPAASPTGSRPFPSSILLLRVPNRMTRLRCPTDRPRHLLYLYSGLRVLQERTCPPRSTFGVKATHIFCTKVSHAKPRQHFSENGATCVATPPEEAFPS